MANPQLENGYTRLANELQDAFCRFRVPGETRQIVDTVIRLTFGYRRTWASITLKDFQKKTNLKKQNARRALSKAIAMNLVIKKDYPIGCRYRLNKDFHTWKRVIQRDYGNPKRLPEVIQNDYLTPSKPLTENALQEAKEKNKKKNICVFSKPQKTKPASKETDPRIKNILSYFHEAVFSCKGFKPELNGQDAKVAQRALRTGTEDALRNMIDFFLDSKKCDEVGITLSAALSAHSINLYRQAWQKKKWQFGDDPEPPTDKRWW